MQDNHQNQAQQKPQVTFGHLENHPNLLFLKNVRVGPFAALYRPQPNLSGKDQYSAVCIISEEQLAFLEDEMKQAAKGLWKDQAKEIYTKLRLESKAARVREDKYLGKYPSVKVSRNAKTEAGKPLLAPKLFQKTPKRNPDEPKVPAKPCVEGEPGSIYDGCYVTLILEAKAYDYKGSKGVKFDFHGMSFERDGEPFIGRTQVSADDFESLADDDTNDDSPDELAW